MKLQFPKLEAYLQFFCAQVNEVAVVKAGYPGD